MSFAEIKRYVVNVKDGKKIIARHKTNDYEDAMNILVKAEEEHGHRYTIEFIDMMLWG